MFRDSFKAFREISFIAVAWLKDTHHSVQEKEARLEQVKQDTQDQGRDIQANIADSGCIQTNYELHEERLERLQGIVRSYEIVLLSQERKLREVGEGSKKIVGDLQVQAQRVEDWDPTSLQGTPVRVVREAWPVVQGTFSIAGSDRLGTSAGGSSTPTAQFPAWPRGHEKQELSKGNPGELQEEFQTPKGSPETIACEAASQEGAGKTTRRSPGSWQSSPQPQGSEPRRGG